MLTAPVLFRFGGEAVSLALNYTQSIFFRGTPYVPLQSGGKESGKVREFGNLSFAVVYEAGHSIPVDNPGVAVDLYNRAIRGRDLATGEKNLTEIVQIPLIPDLPSTPDPDEGGEGEGDGGDVEDGWIVDGDGD